MRQRIVVLATQPETWLCLLLTWALLSALRSYHTPWARAAGTEALHWGAGILLVLALGRGLRRTTEAGQTLTVLLGSLVAAILFEGRHADGLLVGPYGDHQLCASALLAMLPFSLAVGLTSPTPAWRWGAQITTVAGTLCLALTETRSAWFGAGVGGAVFAVLWLRRPTHFPQTLQRRAWIIPVLLTFGVAGAFGLLTSGTDLGLPLTARAQTLQSVASVSQDKSWQARLLTWQGAAVMAAAHPLVGWGLGRYPGAQWEWTHTGRPLAPTQRPSLSEQAHDFYLQTLVETGVVGLALYLAALAALAGRGIHTLRAYGQRRYGLRQALLVALLSLIAGQGVDAIGSPSWQFPEVSLLFWAGLGLGLAATRCRQTSTKDVFLPPFVRRPLRLVAVGAATVTITAQFLPLGFLLPAMATYSPPGGGSYVVNSAYLSGPTTAAAGSTADYRIMAYYSPDGTAKNEYLVNATGDTQSTFSAAQGLISVGSYSIDRVSQVISYTLPSAVPTGGHNIALRGTFRPGGLNASTQSFVLTMQ